MAKILAALDVVAGFPLTSIEEVPENKQILIQSIHHCPNPPAVGSAKRKLLAQRPIALVLMMINSCSYNTNDLVFNLVSDI